MKNDQIDASMQNDDSIIDIDESTELPHNTSSSNSSPGGSSRAVNHAMLDGGSSLSNVDEEEQHKKESRRNRYLLEQTDLFRHFISYKQAKEHGTSYKSNSSISHSATPSVSTSLKEKRKHDHLDDEADPDLSLETAEDSIFRFSSTPPYIKNGEMRDYQIQGLNWLISLYHNDINGILADEMGLGKTLQSLSFLGYLKHFEKIPGPHLIIAPKSTLDNWKKEISHWIPDLNAFIFHGDKEERLNLIKDRIKPVNFEIAITSYEMCLIEKSALKKINWKYIVIDEAHRIKNENSLLSQIVRIFPSSNRLLLTGTPLQNNLHELWALLNFLLPDVFSSSQDFDEWFSSESGDTNKDEIVQQLRRLLNPFLLRRLKIDVERALLPKKEIYLYVGLSDMQRLWYQKILERDVAAVNGQLVGSSKKESKTRLLNIVMQLRKCADHPYLFDGAEPGPPYSTGQHLIDASGKLMVLDSLLNLLKKAGSRVLLFSQMSRVLDILEDYCFLRKHNYCRLDGQTSTEDRIQAIDEYNRPGSSKFLFLLTTRAGGLGINLTSADVVILYDSDWNPQVDLQAQDRAHRIGQKKQVVVFRFVTENTLEEKILERSMQKLRLDQLVIQQGKQSSNKTLSNEEMVAMIRHGIHEIVGKKGKSMEKPQQNVDIMIEDLIRKGEERTSALQDKYKEAGLDDLQRFSSVGTLDNDSGASASLGKSKKENLYAPVMSLTKRERKSTFAADGLYGDSSAILPRGVTAFGTGVVYVKKRRVYPFQFYPPRVDELLKKESAYLGRFRSKSSEDEDSDDEPMPIVEDIKPLTADEKEELETLLETTGFPDWTKRDFGLFIKACERNGRHALNDIALDMLETSKTPDQIKVYSEAFWKNIKSLPDHKKIIAGIEKGEAKLARLTGLQGQLTYFFDHCSDPISIFPKNSHFTKEEDLFLIEEFTALGGPTAELPFERIKERVRLSPYFRFDWFLRTRSPADFSKRINLSLVPSILKWVTQHQQNAEREKAKKIEQAKRMEKEKEEKQSKDKDASTSATKDSHKSKKVAGTKKKKEVVTKKKAPSNKSHAAAKKPKKTPSK